MPAPEKLAALRHLLAERFPSAPRATGSILATGLPAIDHAAGGLPLAAVTEIVCAAPSCGGQLLLGQLLAATRIARTRVALVDSSDSFDPASFPDDLLAHLVWVRCQPRTALAAADLIARDANFGLVVLDLRRDAERPSSAARLRPRGIASSAPSSPPISRSSSSRRAPPCRARNCASP